MKCPGQDSRYWKPGSIFETGCPQCAEPVEFFKDDPTRRCNKCGHKFVNPNMDFGCAAYCKFADQCIGELPPELLAEREGLMKDRVALEIKKYLKKDFKRIGRAVRTARHAEAIVKKGGGDLAIVLTAAYLHPLADSTGTGKQAECMTARELLGRIGAGEAMIEEVCDILRGLNCPEENEPLNLGIVRDAIRIADLEGKFETSDVPTLLTDSARQYAKHELLT